MCLRVDTHLSNYEGRSVEQTSNNEFFNYHYYGGSDISKIM